MLTQLSCVQEVIYIYGILGGISVAGPCMTITCEVDISVGFVLTHVYRNVGYICQLSIMACGSYLQCD